MKDSIKKKTMVVAIFAAILSVQANASVRSKAIVVEFPSDLPELAQGRSEAMYLHHTGNAQAILYLEKDQGRKLAILDVTDCRTIDLRFCPVPRQFGSADSVPRSLWICGDKFQELQTAGSDGRARLPTTS